MLQIALIQILLQSSQVEQKVNRPNKHIQNQYFWGRNKAHVIQSTHLIHIRLTIGSNIRTRRKIDNPQVEHALNSRLQPWQKLNQ